MLVSVDLDGTIDAYPMQMTQLMCALQDAGHSITILSGSGDDPKSGNTWGDKVAYLKSLGVTTCWDQLVVVDGDIPELKAQWCRDNGVSVMIDNNLDNCEAAIAVGVPIALVPWETQTRKEPKGA